jgi:hypothetical protein
MKKVFLTLSLFFVSIALFAGTVTKERAEKYATSYFSSLTQREITVKSIEKVGRGTASYYIINFYPQGWAIISGDDTSKPIIGYSKEGQLGLDDMPTNMRGIMDGFAQEVKYIAEKNTLPNPKWDRPEPMIKANGESVDPLIKVHWNQSSPFNKYCPMAKALVGCVAVAMSQAMSVQQYPDRPVGSISYRSATYGTLSINFDEQKAYNWNQIMNGSDNYDEVARLLMHAGMSVEMDYGEDGSGVPISQLGRIVTALTKNFKYPNTVRLVRRDIYNGDWAQLMKNELNAGRAVIYNGLDTKNSSGHSFNVDGYNADGLFHCNWGWGGHGDAYFSLDGLGYGSDFYDASHIVVIGIDAGYHSLRSIELSHSDIEEGLPVGSVVGQVTVNGEEVKSGMTIDVHGTYSKSSGKYQQVPFVFDNGLLKTSEILKEGKEYTVEITVKDETGDELTQGFIVKVTEVLDLGSATSLFYDRTTKIFTLNTKNNVSYTLKDSKGATIKEGSLSPLPRLSFGREELSVGNNILTLQSPNETLSLTIKK